MCQFCGCEAEYDHSKDIMACEEKYNILLKKVKALIYRFDTLEDFNHETAKTTGQLNIKDVFNSVGTTCGICAEELRIIIKE